MWAVLQPLYVHCQDRSKINSAVLSSVDYPPKHLTNTHPQLFSGPALGQTNRKTTQDEAIRKKLNDKTSQLSPVDVL